MSVTKCIYNIQASHVDGFIRIHAKDASKMHPCIFATDIEHFELT